MPARSDEEEDDHHEQIPGQRLNSAWTLWTIKGGGPSLPNSNLRPPVQGSAKHSSAVAQGAPPPKGTCYPRLNSAADLGMAALSSDAKASDIGTSSPGLRQPGAGSQEATVFTLRVLPLLITIATSIAYMGASAIAILCNKRILVNLDFKYPVTITWLGLLVTTIASAIVVHAWLPASSRRGVSGRYYMTHIMPCGFFMAVAFLTGNISFMYLTLAFVQMLKASTPVVTMCLLFVFQLEKATSKLVISVCVICAGVCVAGYGEVNVSLIGVASMLTSVFAEALRLVLTQFLMDPKGGELHPMEGLMYISSACCMWLLAQAMLGEWTRLLEHKAYLKMMENPIPFLTSAMAGFGVNVLAILVIKRASSLTLKVLGTVKDAALVVISVALLKEQVGQLQLLGYVVSLGGFVAYNVAKATTAPVQAGPVSPSSVVKLA